MSDTDNTTLSQDVSFDLLSNARRRFVLRELQQTSDEVELVELAERLAAKENEVPRDDLTAQQRKRTYVSLYQTHVPKLVEAKVVTYDQDTGRIAATERADELANYFREECHSPPWALAYGLLAGVGLVAYAALHVVNAGPLEPTHVGGTVIFTLFLVSLVHYTRTNQFHNSGGLVPVERE
ncbi:hypothetical protein U4E84_02575 [Halorubrum sp. AD140]|uniref:DUF7344 domain-containing protein n=1 Tax=Halorubrum sp. AD140 TaxID=3050073 RepID=UPI002ACC4535|nr:hypothetical protein [Halorubrum sp. AD140]MDZ5810241.1 hypothetical protein [Halorubrum sp. AD140]